MIDTRVGSWQELGAHAQAIRTQVFIEEQNIPAEMEWDTADAQAVHALASNRFGLPLGPGRLLQHAPGVARIGRMAVSQTVRGSGVGRALLNALSAVAQQRGDHEIVLHAQTSAQAFYARSGFSPRGAVFEEAGIAHIEMTRRL